MLSASSHSVIFSLWILKTVKSHCADFKDIQPTNCGSIFSEEKVSLAIKNRIKSCAKA